VKAKHGLDSEDIATLDRGGKRIKVKSEGGSESTKLRTSSRGKPRHPQGLTVEEAMNELISSLVPSVSREAGTSLENSREPLAMSGDENQPAVVVNSTEQDSMKVPPSTGIVKSEIPMGEAQSADGDQAVQLSDAASVHRRNLSTTSSVSETPKEIRHRSEQNDPPKQGKKAKVNIEFVYRVILSRTPVYLCKGWQPNGKFQEKSLRELLTELPLEGTIKGLTFVLEGPGMRIEEQIEAEDENHFESMKRHFNKRIRACLANWSPSKGPLMVEIEIEPLRDESDQGNDEADDAGFSW
jgi:hypothetical protein